VRLDSGDLIALSRSVRRILDDGGLTDVTIFASGGIDETTIANIIRSGAPIDGFGIGSSLTTSSDAPGLDCVYKLEEYAGLPRRKRSAGKATWPGRKQVWRRFKPDGRMAADVLSVEDDAQQGEPLIEVVMHGGKRLKPAPTLAEVRARAARDLERLPEPLRRLEPAASYPVEVSDALRRLRRRSRWTHGASAEAGWADLTRRKGLAPACAAHDVIRYGGRMLRHTPD